MVNTGECSSRTATRSDETRDSGRPLRPGQQQGVSGSASGRPHRNSSVARNKQSWDGGSDTENGDKPRDIDIDGKAMQTKARVGQDGRIKVEINAKTKLPDLPPSYACAVHEYGIDLTRPLQVPQLQVVIFIVGSRGDVQPYLALALQMIAQYNHRVRIATHNIFEKFVLEQAAWLEGRRDSAGRDLAANLEFYGIGGDPKDLMAYMVKNPGLMPGLRSLTNGDISRKKKMVKEMLGNFYDSTFLPCPQTGAPFAADAIISNPPAFAHIHIAEALGIPLTMTFTMPWSATTAFSHPLVAVDRSNASRDLTNYLTFALAEALTWQGLGGVINSFRSKRLALERLSLTAGASVLDRLKVPYIYCWSEALIPKPNDWMQHIDITGFLFLPNEGYKPGPELAAFLASGPPPMYIGFGSIVIDDPRALTKLLLGAISRIKTRVLLSAGWSNLGGMTIPDNVHLLGDCPHDWLFANGRVSAVCIHGGAGTTAIALRNGLPVIVVPFFGDQPFWGQCIAEQGAGPAPIPFKTLTEDNLAEAMHFALSEETRAAARRMGQFIRGEDSCRSFIEAFHAHLPLLHMRCDIDPTLAAVWWSPKFALRLSGKIAALLVSEGKLTYSSLEVWRPSMYDTQRLAPDPITGGSVAVLKAVAEFGEGMLRVFSLRPDKGVLMMCYAAPKALATTLFGLTEGMEQLPKLYGTQEKRQRTKVKDIKSGFIAGGKALVYGLTDGVSGVVTEPMTGRKRNGGRGFATGLARGCANLVVQPAAGVFGLVSHPVKGIGKSIVRSTKKDHPETALVQPRKHLGQQALSHVTLQDKTDFIRRFDDLLRYTEQRKSSLKAEAVQWFEALKEEIRLGERVALMQSSAAAIS